VLEKFTHLQLTSSSHLREYIPIVREAHSEEIRAYLKGKEVGLALDAASRDGECFAVTARTIDPKTFVAKTCLIAARMYALSFNGVQLAGALNNLAHEVGVHPDKIIVTMRDRARYGEVAMDVLKPMWPRTLDMECLAHTLNRVGSSLLTLI
jgi:hypothetical protein